MNEIVLQIEKLLMLCGIHGTAIIVVRHISMVVVAFLLAWFCGLICKKIIVPIIEKVTAKTSATWDDVIFSDKVLLTACKLIPAIVLWTLLPRVFFQFHIVRILLERLTAIYITIMATTLILAFIDGINKLDTSASSSVKQYVKSFTGVLRIIAIFFAVIIAIAVAFGKNPIALVAGLGATSAVLMLVFKDTIEGLVAGVRLTSNNMVHRGDWITVPSTEANGIVLDISLTTVKVQNFDNTIVTVSPTTLVNGSFQNWKGMQVGEGRRVKRLVYFDFRSVCIASDELKTRIVERKYLTEDEVRGMHVNMELFRMSMEHFLRTRPEVNENMSLMVRQLEATNAGLPVEFYFFLKKKEWVAYEHELATIMEWIYAIATDFELTIYQQYPEQ